MKFQITIVFTVLFAVSGALALTFDSDIPADVKTQFQSDLSLINQVTGSGATPLHQEIFGAVEGATYKKFFESRVKSVGLDSCGGGTQVAACVIPFFDARKMWVTPNFIKASMPQIARIMIIYHEARHTEEDMNYWSHAKCPTPYRDENGKDIVGIVSGAKLEGQDACDVTPHGSYGASTIMIKNIAKFCTNCSDKVKMDAEIWTQDQLNRISRAEAKQKMKEDFSK